jgi:hypothetical protein
LATNGSASPLVSKLSSARINLPFNIDPYLDEAQSLGLIGDDAYDYALARVRETPEYNAYFPGIKRPDGTLIMNEAQYEQYYQSAVSTAAEYGFGLTRTQIGTLVQRGVSPDEFTIRANAVHVVRTRPDILVALNSMIGDMNSQRRKLGLNPVPSLSTPADVISFFTGAADRDVYDAYDAAQISAVAKSYGLSVTNQRARELAGLSPGITDFEATEKAFGEIAQAGRAAGAYIYARGFTQRDLETVAFGGPNRGVIAAGIQSALEQAQAQNQSQQAQADVSVTPGGLPVVAEAREVGL